MFVSLQLFLWCLFVVTLFCWLWYHCVLIIAVMLVAVDSCFMSSIYSAVLLHHSLSPCPLVAGFSFIALQISYHCTCEQCFHRYWCSSNPHKMLWPLCLVVTLRDILEGSVLYAATIFCLIFLFFFGLKKFMVTKVCIGSSIEFITLHKNGLLHFNDLFIFLNIFVFPLHSCNWTWNCKLIAKINSCQVLNLCRFTMS